MTNKQYPSFSLKELALVTSGHRNTLQLRVFFCKLFINTRPSISCKYWVSFDSKPLIITQLAQFGPQYTTITRFRLRVPTKMQVLDFRTLAFFFFPFAPRLHHRMGPFMPKSRHFHIPSTKTTLFVDSSRFLNCIPKVGYKLIITIALYGYAHLPFLHDFLSGTHL